MRALFLVSLPLLTFATTGAAQDPGASPSGLTDSRQEQQQTQKSPTQEQVQSAQDSSEQLPTLPVPQQEAQPAPVVQDAQPAPIEEVIVTATKRQQSVRDIAGTVNVLSGEALEKSGAQGIDDIVRLVPGLTMTEEGTNPKRVTIRGVAADTGGNLTTGVLIGDVPFSDLYLPRVALDPNPFDLATVEVLKGPQGTLFGGSGLNGAIRYVPEMPKYDETEAKYFVQYTSYLKAGETEPVYGGMLNAPVSDSLALRLVGFKRRSPGYVDNTLTGKDGANSVGQDGLRAILGWRPAEDWQITLMHMRQTTDTHDLGYASNSDGRLEHDNEPRPSTINTHYELTNLGIEGKFSWGNFISQTSTTRKTFSSYYDYSRLVLGGRLPLLATTTDNDSDGIIQEFRLVSVDDPDSRWKWLIGAFGNRVKQNDCVDSPVTLLPAGIPLPIPIPVLSAETCPDNPAFADNPLNLSNYRDKVTASELALFGEVSRKLGKRWELTGGARFYRVETEGTVMQSGAAYLPGTGRLSSEHNAGIKEPGISPKLVLSYSMNRDLMAYLSASRGFRFGGIQASAGTVANPIPSTYKSDSLWNYELGLRSSWLDHALIADVSAYFIDWKNPQLYQLDTSGLNAYFDNVGGAHGRGVETQLQLRPPFLHGISLSVSSAFNETVTTEPFTTASGTQVEAGTAWPSSPRWQVATTLAWQGVVGNVYLSTSLSHRYTSKAYNNLEHSAAIFNYHTLDFQLSASSVNLSWLPEVSLSLNNLTDERGVSSILVGNVAPAVGFTDTIYIPPRALIVRLSGSF